MNKTFDLQPSDSHKSFYGKAKVQEYTDINGINVAQLKSYQTIVAVIENGKDFFRTWSGYSATTMRHVNAFLDYYGISGGGKSWWDNQPVTRNKY